MWLASHRKLRLKTAAGLVSCKATNKNLQPACPPASVGLAYGHARGMPMVGSLTGAPRLLTSGVTAGLCCGHCFFQGRPRRSRHAPPPQLQRGACSNVVLSYQTKVTDKLALLVKLAHCFALVRVRVCRSTSILRRNSLSLTVRSFARPDVLPAAHAKARRVTFGGKVMFRLYDVAAGVTSRVHKMEHSEICHVLAEGPGKPRG